MTAAHSPVLDGLHSLLTRIGREGGELVLTRHDGQWTTQVIVNPGDEQFEAHGQGTLADATVTMVTALPPRLVPSPFAGRSAPHLVPSPFTGRPAPHRGQPRAQTS